MSRRGSRSGMVAPSAVEKLIEQRRLIQDWLAKLDDGSNESMPPHVIARVRNDYQGRLTAVVTELGEHADGVRQSLADAETRHQALESEQTARRDELAELKLRRQVGELDEGKFKEQNQRLKALVDDLAKDMSAALKDIERYEEILDIISGKEKREEREEGEVGEVAKVEVVAEKKAVEPPPPPPPPAPATPPAPAVDELSFLRSVTGVISAQKAPEAAAPPPPPPPPPEPPPPPPPPEPPAVAEEKPFFVREQGPGEVKEQHKTRRSSTSAADTAARTLLCKECGALNLPTEWYCEKCGADLAAF